MPSGKLCYKRPKRSRKLTDHGKQLLPRALQISNVIVVYDTERIMGNDRWRERSGERYKQHYKIFVCLLQLVRGFLYRKHHKKKIVKY